MVQSMHAILFFFVVVVVVGHWLGPPVPITDTQIQIIVGKTIQYNNGNVGEQRKSFIFHFAHFTTQILSLQLPSQLPYLASLAVVQRVGGEY